MTTHRSLFAVADGIPHEVEPQEWFAEAKTLTFNTTDLEAAVWRRALAALASMPNRERIWI